MYFYVNILDCFFTYTCNFNSSSLLTQMYFYNLFIYLFITKEVITLLKLLGILMADCFYVPD